MGQQRLISHIRQTQGPSHSVYIVSGGTRSFSLPQKKKVWFWIWVLHTASKLSFVDCVFPFYRSIIDS